MLNTPSLAQIDPAHDEPIECRMFQFTDLLDNHNKFYLVELWPAPVSSPDKVRFRVSWGRVGSSRR